jgi:hypothetical protein
VVLAELQTEVLVAVVLVVIALLFLVNLLGVALPQNLPLQ